MQDMDAFRRVITSVPGIDDHDANSVSLLEQNLHTFFISCIVFLFFPLIFINISDII